jgi:adenosine deaminase CECR1
MKHSYDVFASPDAAITFITRLLLYFIFTSIFSFFCLFALKQRLSLECSNVEQYRHKRAKVIEDEQRLAFDWECRQNASAKEHRANGIIQKLKLHDNIQVYGNQPARNGYGGQMHLRKCGDHFLSNVDLIEESEIFKIAQKMPKGGHLHIHFNTNLKPCVLLDIAKDMPRMFISSDIQLSKEADFISYERCKIQFHILNEEKEREKPGNLFNDYKERQTMKFSSFIEKFPEHRQNISAMDWLESKLVFSEEEVHHRYQTSEG